MTGVSKGSAFVKFESASSSQDCVRFAESVGNAKTGASTGTDVSTVGG